MKFVINFPIYKYVVCICFRDLIFALSFEGIFDILIYLCERFNWVIFLIKVTANDYICFRVGDLYLKDPVVYLWDKFFLGLVVAQIDVDDEHFEKLINDFDGDNFDVFIDFLGDLFGYIFEYQVFIDSYCQASTKVLVIGIFALSSMSLYPVSRRGILYDVSSDFLYANYVWL
jgi:hypothetical protein